MNIIALFTENHSISYTAIIVTAAVVATVVCAVLTAISLKRSVAAVITCAGISSILALLCSRALYWYCAPEQFSGSLPMFSDMGSGGYCLAGAMIGVVLSAFITSRLRFSDGFLSLLDCIAPAAALGIGLGRLSGFVSNDDKGNLVFDNPKLQGLPLSVPVTDRATGAVRWQFASFFWESMAGFAIFAILMVMVFRCISKGTEAGVGDIAMAFLCLFGATQASLESTRDDVLHMRSNGFISMMQMVALIMILIPPVYYTVKGLRNGKRSAKIGSLLVKWVVIIAAVSGAGVAEYFIQRKGGLALMIYPVQMGLLLLTCVMTFLISRGFSVNITDAGLEAPCDEEAYEVAWYDRVDE